MSGGTPAYMSPEEASGGTPSEAGDWYGVGVTLYEALDRDAAVRRYGHRTAPPQETDRSAGAGGLAPDVPPDLSAICMGLLRRDPAQRLSGAAVLRQLARDAATAGRGHRAGAGPRHAIRRPRSSASGVERGAPGGRERARAAVSVSGPSGIGKSALVRRFLSRIARPRRCRSCSPAAATRTSRCRSRRSTEWSTI